jgi:hypothetical protein
MVHAPNGTRAKWHTRQMAQAPNGTRAKWYRRQMAHTPLPTILLSFELNNKVKYFFKIGHFRSQTTSVITCLKVQQLIV